MNRLQQFDIRLPLEIVRKFAPECVPNRAPIWLSKLSQGRDVVTRQKNGLRIFEQSRLDPECFYECADLVFVLTGA